MTSIWRWGLAAALTVGLGVLTLFTPHPTKAFDRVLPAWPPHAGGAVTIAFMGTSLTAGAPWPDKVIAALAACMPHPVRAQRFAKGGATSAWGLAQVEGVIVAAPDIVVVEFAINDADLRRGMSRATSADTHHALLTRLKQGLPQARIVLMTTNPVFGLRRLLRPRLAGYYALYHQLATDHDTGLIDLTPRWLALPDPAQSFIDGLHPTDAAAIAVVVPVVTSYLAGLLGRNCAL